LLIIKLGLVAQGLEQPTVKT